MQNKIEIKYVGDTEQWQMTVCSDIAGIQVVSLSTSQAMAVAAAIGIAKDIGKKEGYSKAKEKYAAVKRLSNYTMPWSDAEYPMTWNMKMNDPNA